jgi:hypothetical protein
MKQRLITWVLLALCFILTEACAPKEKPASIPADFVFVLDARGRQNHPRGSMHFHIVIDAQGAGRFEDYDPHGVLHYDMNKMVTHDPSQIVRTGTFRLTNKELDRIVTLLDENDFFALKESYQMELGDAYAFIMVQMNSQQHIVDNIGMEVPAIRAIVEGVNLLLPDEIDLQYGKGFKF